MVALTEGTKAPAFTLLAVDGARFNLEEKLKSARIAVLAFYKASCPVCQLAFPYLERLARMHPDLPIWGISQDDVEETLAFARTYEITFPILTDSKLAQTVAYGLTNVPSIFLVEADLSIQLASIGFSKAGVKEIGRRLGRISQHPGRQLFTEADDVPDFRPG